MAQRLMNFDCRKYRLRASAFGGTQFGLVWLFAASGLPPWRRFYFVTFVDLFAIRV
jgi:hypothetical protein